MTAPKRPRILLVDDEAGTRRAFVRALPQFEIIEAADGVEAVALLEKHSFDAVMTDLDMPRMSGDALVAWIEANQPELAPCVVIITGGAKAPEQVAWLEARDPACVLAKPASIGDIVRAIGNAIHARSS